MRPVSLTVGARLHWRRRAANNWVVVVVVSLWKMRASAERIRAYEREDDR